MGTTESSPEIHSKLFMSYDIVGGDYYAIQPLDENRYGFLLADMEGHGMAAALYAMHLRIQWNRHFQLVKRPADFAAAVNDELVKLFGSVVTFATAVCGAIDAQSGQGHDRHIRYSLTNKLVKHQN
jgi:serine phosphatase RsbU (regulator of sigma subunit)